VEEFIPIFAIFCTIGLPITAWMLFRLLKHRERMEMIRHGLAPDGRGFTANMGQPIGAPFVAPPPPPYTAAGRGRGRKNSDEHDPPDVTLRKGVRLTMIGIALTIGLSFVGLHGDSFHPGPWLLGGLIPMFVGLSHVILALLSGATLGARPQAWAPGDPWPFPPKPPSSGGSPGPQSYDTSYTYRPGDRTELQPPHSPPEPRR